jgi:hypothetical protein
MRDLHHNGREREKQKQKQNKINHRPITWDVGLKRARTFGDFDSFHRLVVYGAGTLFDELIAFDTEIEDVCALHE